MDGGKSDVVSCRHAQRSHPATSATKRGPEKCRDELIHLQNYPGPALPFKPAILAACAAPQSVRFEIDAQSFLFRGCMAIASCREETRNRLDTIAILAIANTLDAPLQRLHSQQSD